MSCQQVESDLPVRVGTRLKTKKSSRSAGCSEIRAPYAYKTSRAWRVGGGGVCCGPSLGPHVDARGVTVEIRHKGKERADLCSCPSR